MTKTPKDSHNIMSELVLPNDTNTLGNLMGGRLMYWMDIAGAISAMKHCNSPLVTASVDNLSFANPIKLGNLLVIESWVTRAFNSSMEVYIKVTGEDLQSQFRYVSNEAYFTYVGLDPHGKPKRVPELEPTTEEERKMYDSALHRRQIRLVLGGKLKPSEAPELMMLLGNKS